MTQSDFCEHEWEYVGGVKVHLYLIFILDIPLYIMYYGNKNNRIRGNDCGNENFGFLALKRPDAA